MLTDACEPYFTSCNNYIWNISPVVKVSMGIGKYWRHPSFIKFKTCLSMSSLLTTVERPQLLWQLFNSAQSQQFTQLSSLLFGAYPLSLSNLMYSLYKSLSHLTNFVIERSPNSFIPVYYIKVLRYAVVFANFLARPLFGKEGAQASSRQMKEGGRDTNGQSGRNKHNQLTTTLVY